LSDRVGYSDHVRFRGYLPVHWCSGLQPPCLRFASGRYRTPRKTWYAAARYRKNASRAITHIVTKSKVRDLIEFSRSIHAEMHAILLGSQTAGERVKGGKLFSTTYPCHSCARHIIASGIKEVYYIEPYRKSLGTKLHDDAITEDEGDNSKVRILPFDGVAPTRYLKFFNVAKSSRKSEGKMVKIDSKSALPRFENKLEAFHTLEGLIVRGLQEKSLLPVEQ
jgi:deoxycytidylate deaminase